MQVQSLGQEDPLEKMATHLSIPAWRILWTEEAEGDDLEGWVEVVGGGRLEKEGIYAYMELIHGLYSRN